MRRVRLALLLGGALAIAMAPSVAHAAPAYVASQPAAGSEMQEAPEEVRVVFNQPLDLSSTIVVVDECMRRVDDNDVTVAGNTISVGISKTPSGEYTALYRVQAPQGVGGTAGGKVSFTVTSGKSCGPAAGTNRGGHGGHGEHSTHEGGGGDGGTHNDHGTSTDHGGHDAGTSGATTHAGHDGSMVLASGQEHSTSGHGQHGSTERKRQGGQAAQGGEGNGDEVLGERPTLASPFDDAAEAVGGSTVLGALLASLVLGAGGGWIVRTMNI